MRPDKLTIHDLFQRERRYVVPLYQRPYVWGEEEQWSPLWDDLERQAEACLEGGDRGSRRSHFLGAIVLNVARTVGADVARSEVIDGQQRLTTLQIVIAALRDEAESMGSSHAGRLRRLTEHEDQRPGSESAFKVWPTNADRELFRIVMTAGSSEALMKSLGVDRQTAPRMAACYMFFSDKVREFIRTGAIDQREARLFALLQALRTALQVVVIELEDEDDPQVIFETLNARGQPLLPSDLVRNYVFRQATHQHDGDADDLYARYWEPFDVRRVEEAVEGEDRFWHLKERQGRLTRPRIDLFLFHYLVMQTERDLNIGQLFREFREWRADNPGPIEALLADLKSHADVFARLVEPVGHDRASVFARRLEAMDSHTIYPVLLHLFSLPPERLPRPARDQIVEDLESWLVRRFVGGLTIKNYNRFFVGLLQKLKHAAADADLPGVVRAELTRSSDPTTAWPSDEDFRTAWLGKPLYAKSRPDRSAMVLRAIEERMHSRRNEAIGLPDRLTVEHLLPQKGTLVNYPYAAAMPRRESESDDVCRERMINTIGNLTLLTGELNASVSNGPFPTKVVKIVEDSDLRLNAWLRSDPPSAWSEGDIVARGEDLLQFALQLWPRPEVQPENLADEDGATERGVWVFTDSALLTAKRRQLVEALSRREALPLSAESTAKHRSARDEVRCVVAVSKHYTERGRFPYWYGYRPDWHTYLGAAEKGYLLLGCMDRDEGFAVPVDVLEAHLPLLATSVAKDGPVRHWHIHLVERRGGLALLLPKSDEVLELNSYLLPLKVAADVTPAG
jgi:hypothetical protein